VTFYTPKTNTPKSEAIGSSFWDAMPGPKKTGQLDGIFTHELSRRAPATSENCPTNELYK